MLSVVCEKNIDFPKVHCQIKISSTEHTKALHNSGKEGIKYVSSPFPMALYNSKTVIVVQFHAFLSDSTEVWCVLRKFNCEMKQVLHKINEF